MIDLGEHSTEVHTLIVIATVNDFLELVQGHCLHDFFEELVRNGVAMQILVVEVVALLDRVFFLVHLVVNFLCLLYLLLQCSSESDRKAIGLAAGTGYWSPFVTIIDLGVNRVDSSVGNHLLFSVLIDVLTKYLLIIIR